MNAPAPVIDHAVLAAQLPDVGDGLASQLADLAIRPTAERCERAALNLDGARQMVLRLREQLLRGAE